MTYLPSTGMFMVLLCGIAVVSHGATYSDKYDNVDIGMILSSERLLKRYVSCLLDEGPCTADGRFFRDLLPEALATNCAKCTDKMRSNVKKVSNHMRNGKPEIWLKFVDKYDPERKYRESFERFLNEQH